MGLRRRRRRGNDARLGRRKWIKAQGNRIIPKIEIRQGRKPAQDGRGATQTSEAVASDGEGIETVDAEEGTEVFEGVEIEVEGAGVRDAGAEGGGQGLQGA